jgi:N-carbamoylputrescine amidase
MTGKLRLALVQHACSEHPADNVKQTLSGVRQAAAEGVELVLTQELFSSRYFCQSEVPAAFDLAQPIPGPHTQALGAVAAELGVVVVASVFERRAPGVYHNTAVVLERDGRLTGRYRKMHLPDDPGYHEKYYFTPGDLGFRPIDTSVGRLGVLVCWDQWYPEAARLMALAGAELLLYPTAIGWERRDPAEEQARQHEAWRTLQRAHAIANALPLAACNRTGFEPHPTVAGEGIDFWGGSFVCGPQGEILAEAPAREPAVLLADVDLSRAEELRRIWPFLRDRRIDAYGGLLERYLD